jgi:RNA polymerase sigma-70 factor (ECF subfamily)
MAPVHDHRVHFVSLLEAHRKLLLKVCWAYGRTPDDRDDLLQDIIVRLWESFGRYDSERAFSTWMHRIALNVAIDFRRRQRRWGRETPGLADVAPAAPTDDAERREQLADLHELLECQTEVDRAILLLALENHSYHEIGKILGISESNVGTRMSRLKKSLKQSVQQETGNAH